MYANLISISRLLLAIPLYFAVIGDSVIFIMIFTAWVIFSDALDGWVARRYGSHWTGALLDPLADAACISSVLLGLFHLHIIGYLWVMFFFVRYIFFVISTIFIKKKYKYYISATIWNKLSIILMVIFLLSSWWYHTTAWKIGSCMLIFQVVSMIEVAQKLFTHHD